jgi:hypothetical protein
MGNHIHEFSQVIGSPKISLLSNDQKSSIYKFKIDYLRDRFFLRAIEDKDTFCSGQFVAQNLFYRLGTSKKTPRQVKGALFLS